MPSSDSSAGWMAGSTPFVLPPNAPRNRTTRCGRGMLVPVTLRAGVEATVQHNLGRVVVGVQAAANRKGANPEIALTPAFSSTAKQSLKASADIEGFLFLW